MIDLETQECVIVGTGECTGGDRPDPPIDGFPLLIFAGGMVRTEDRNIPVYFITNWYDPQLTSIARFAELTGTTPAHVEQALAYAQLSRTKAGQHAR